MPQLLQALIRWRLATLDFEVTLIFKVAVAERISGSLNAINRMKYRAKYGGYSLIEARRILPRFRFVMRMEPVMLIDISWQGGDAGCWLLLHDDYPQ